MNFHEEKPTLTKNCPECGKDFETTSKQKIVCGEECKKERKRKAKHKWASYQPKPKPKKKKAPKPKRASERKNAELTDPEVRLKNKFLLMPARAA